jgi:hypothetical protein
MLEILLHLRHIDLFYDIVFHAHHVIHEKGAREVRQRIPFSEKRRKIIFYFSEKYFFQKFSSLHRNF